jgi:hypothetical protein
MHKMQEIALIYAREQVGGGSTSFTVHLYEGFKQAGIPFRLLRFTDRPKRPRRLAGYTGVIAEYVTPDEMRAIVRSQPSVLLAPEHSRHLPEPDILSSLAADGMRLVIHDPNEFMARTHAKIFDHLQNRSIIKRPIAIRPSMKTHFKDAVFIPHPYWREYEGWQGKDLMKRGAGCTIARLTFVKRPTIILDANRLLTPAMQIKIHGAENRLFTYTKVLPHYPEFKQGGYNLPLEWGISARMARQHRFAVDMTYFPEDGGGSQYTFMEAWDAGSVNICHKDWLRYEGEMKHRVNCWAVESPEELAKLIKNSYSSKSLQTELRKISVASTEHLERKHDPATIARAYYKELTR